MKKIKKVLFKVLSILLLISTISGCASDRISRDLATVNDLPAVYKDYRKSNSSRQFMKFHLNNGQVIAGKDWSYSDSTKSVSIYGFRYSINRNPIDTGTFNIKYNDIALAEKNYVKVSLPQITYLILTVWTTALLYYGALNPFQMQM